MKESACVLVFLSRRSVEKRGYVQKEFKLTLRILDELPDGQLFLIPILIDDCDVIHSGDSIGFDLTLTEPLQLYCGPLR